ncbi:MAG: enoyl-CoA hydratase/isomerase family protein [Pseudomonadota bacterium]|nr:enoyl-CoA hydratase/isomerase family protein [Pseudomonadota bacterium]MDE3038682.1 enoyl-CoA hydratase/isomerase family protein [Pseudomonadota bacterium]
MVMTLIASLPEPQIALATLNRPERANALNTQLAQEITAFFRHLPKDRRAVILTGAGKHFCAGADLKDRQGMNETAWQEQHSALEAALHAVLQCEIPVIAAVNGAAMGGGLELALACDFIYAADNARFALTETTLGIMPGLGGTQTLPRAVGLQRAKELIFSGKSFTAAEALAWGMVGKVVPPEKLLEETQEVAKIAAANAPLAVKFVKNSMNQGVDMSLAEAMAADLARYATLLSTHDRQEGINAFNQKRKPSFTGQ